MKTNTAITEPALLESSPLEEVESFTYLGSLINRIGKARTALLQLQIIWKSRQLSQRTKMRIFKLKFKASFTLWCRDMDDNKSNHHKSTNFHQQLPPENPRGALTRQDPISASGKEHSSSLQTRTWMDRAHAEEHSG